ncbi:MAG: redoxin domain-containing protein [Candidatus Lokiarchaeota archaeon]|nr:redoxin domain-containing protein [Candidatus Lokiarchaeota archaeon]MBD3201418.1 redoxin domain-containing protein [Candidatus Lokiarchaeota archaeon]
MANQAMEIPSELEWLNTDQPLSMEKLKGHVVLLDFWTYCCINCIHVLEDLKILEKKYENEPFLVIGVHSPKFKNEKDKQNIRSAIARYEIEHPVLVDNNHVLWKYYEINAWPSFVLINPEGSIIGKTAGEGKRELLDKAISNILQKSRQKRTLAKMKLKITSDIHIESFLKFPGKIFIDKTEGTLYISDSNHNRIIELELMEENTANVKSIIGEGKEGYKNGNFSESLFRKPQGIIKHKNRLLIADTNNHVIREIDYNLKKVRTIAGNGKQGYTRKYKGDPLSISLSSPWDLEIGDDYLYIAMAGTHQIWRLNLDNNQLESFAGSGIENIVDGDLKKAALSQPSGLAYEKNRKRLYFADSEVSALRYIDLINDKVETLIGKGLFVFGNKEGPFKDALLQHPLGLDATQNEVYIADTYNHAIRIADLREEKLENLIHRPRKGVCKIGDKDCDYLPLYEPNDIVLYENKLYIADTNNHLIRTFSLKTELIEDMYILES